MEDKYRAREIVEQKKSGNLPELYHWSDQTHKIPWDKLPLRCVIKTNHWSGDALFIMDNDEESIAGIERKFNPFNRSINRYRVIRNGRDQNGGFWPRWRIERKLKSCLKENFPVPLEWAQAIYLPGESWWKNYCLMTAKYRPIGKFMFSMVKQDLSNMILGV